MRVIPFESIMMSIVLEQHKRIKQLEARLAQRENTHANQREGMAV
ncbi:MAG TPA: hypothetical protein VIH68_01720 [Bacteroidota bacterium]